MAARTLEIDFSAAGAAAAVIAAGGTQDGSGGTFTEGTGYFPGRAERIKFVTYAGAADFAGNWHLEIECNPEAITPGPVNNTAFHQSQSEELQVTSITRSSTTATLAVVEHDYIAGDLIDIKLSAVSAWNTQFTVTSVTATTVVFTCAGTEADDTASVARVMRNYNKQLFAAYRTAGTGVEHIMLYRLNNGNFSLLEKSNSTQVVSNFACSSIGKGNTVRIDLDEVAGTLYFRVDGALIGTRVRTQASTSAQFNTFFIGGGSFSPNYFGQGFIKRFKLTNETFFPAAQSDKVVIFGDSYITAGSPGSLGVGSTTASYGYPVLDAGLATKLQSIMFLRTGKAYNVVGHGNNGHGWSETNPSTLSDQVADMLTENPTVVWCHGSVNDVQDTELAADYQESWENMIDAIFAHGTVRKLIISTVPPISNVALYDTAQVKKNTLEANEIIRNLAAYDSRVWVHDHFAEVNGFNYEHELTIGSARYTTDATDLHWTPKGHANAARLRADILLEALNGKNQTADRRFITGGVPSQSTARSLIGNLIT